MDETTPPVEDEVVNEAGADAATETAAETSAETGELVVEGAASFTDGVTWLAWLGDYPMAKMAISIGVLVLFAWLAHYLVRRFVLTIFLKLIERSTTTWDDAMVEQNVLHRLVPIAPALVVMWGVVFVPELSTQVVEYVQRLTMATIVVLGARSVSAFMAAVNDIYARYAIAKGRPIKGYIQIVQIFVYIVAAIVIISALMNESPFFLLSGLGAMTAVLLLIFRDTLLSLVAGIQLTSNDLIRVGDWIEVPGFGADGDVVDIALNTVRVQNWDRTMTVIPTHKFLDNSFKNWRSVFDSGGRRIMRSIHLDMSSIRFLTPDEIEKFRRYVVLKEYIDEKTAEIDQHNKENIPADLADVRANTRHLTNVGTFRAYVTQFLRQHPKIHKEMTFLVRQLQPTAQGLPIQIYVFSNDTRWVFYEGIQADIFDHLLAILPEFGLRVFQEPTGSDFSNMSQMFQSTGPGSRPLLTEQKAEPQSV